MNLLYLLSRKHLVFTSTQIIMLQKIMLEVFFINASFTILFQCSVSICFTLTFQL